MYEDGDTYTQVLIVFLRCLFPPEPAMCVASCRQAFRPSAASSSPSQQLEDGRRPQHEIQRRTGLRCSLRFACLRFCVFAFAVRLRFVFIVLRVSGRRSLHSLS